MSYLRRFLLILLVRPLSGTRFVLELFSQAMVAGAPLAHFTNFHDTLTNIHQTPSAIAGAACSLRVSCVQAPAHRVAPHALVNPSQS
jgi:hypothetical protein